MPLSSHYSCSPKPIGTRAQSLEQRRLVQRVHHARRPDTFAGETDRGWQNVGMTFADIDSYLASIEEPKRSTLAKLRDDLHKLLPDAEESISYGLPAFKVQGKTVAGFAAFKNHLSYLPHSGSVLAALGEDLGGYQRTQGSLHFAVDRPLPSALVKKLVTARLGQLGL